MISDLSDNTGCSCFDETTNKCPVHTPVPPLSADERDYWKRLAEYYEGLATGYSTRSPFLVSKNHQLIEELKKQDPTGAARARRTELEELRAEADSLINALAALFLRIIPS